MNKSTQGPETKNLVFAILAATAIMVAWQHFYERPRMIAAQAQQAKVEAAKAQTPAPAAAKADVAEVTSNAPRIRINTPSLHGSISTIGGRFDDLTLAQYHEEISNDSPEVKLLNRASAPDAYFIELGMLAADDSTQKMPNATTQWQTADKELTVDHPATLTWNNGSGLKFTRTIAVDDHFMFTVTTSVQNAAATPVTLYPYGRITRNYPDTGKHFMHEGPLGVIGNVLEDVTYKQLREDSTKKFDGNANWVGIADKYWLTALIPDGGDKYDAEFKHFTRNDADAYQADMPGSPVTIPVGETAKMTTHIFAGAKIVDQIDAYQKAFNIPLFDRAVDFGALYFIMRPIFSLLSYFHTIVGNFGVAIILLTLCIKACLFPLASKSMTSMSKMKLLSPKMNELKERHKDDKMKLNQEIMALYKREKVNPVSGCLPIVVQIPIFLALYRVLSATIEMRHAPFIGWIHDLSAVDQTNIFTAFGLINWVPPHFMHLGVLPLIMCGTMIIQQRLNPKPADPVQAAMMNYMPFIFLFMFANFPAGLVIYWICNNTLSILQQLYINRRLKKQGLK